MTLVPLKIPPGIVRPGTVYDAKGRWYEAQLVRWRDQAMKPVGGWAELERTSLEAVTEAYYHDGVSFTNETTDINDADADDVNVLIDDGDIFYFGFGFPFEEVVIDISTDANSTSVIWEYWDGSAWTQLNVTAPFWSITAGTHTLTWTRPLDWAKTTVNGGASLFFIRVRAIDTIDGSVLAQQAWIGRGPVRVTGPVRGMHTWRIVASAVPTLAFGTPDGLYSFASGDLRDITPSGLTAGQADASLSSGGNFGDGVFGAGLFGVGDESQVSLVEATTWALDNFGEDLVACSLADGKIYASAAGAAQAAEVSGSPPTGNLGIVVTPERFLVVLGADGNPRGIAWCDQENYDLWSPAATNQAGDEVLQSKGQIMMGLAGKDETLIWTETDLFNMVYVGGQTVYRVRRVGSQAGVISRRAAVVYNGTAFWMGPRGFFMYDGFSRPLACPLSDYIFSDMNRVQASKIVAGPNSGVDEIVWYYPSGASDENDRYVSLNVVTNVWTMGFLQRTAWADLGSFTSPFAADASGQVYLHEQGFGYRDVDGVTELVPYAISGPVELGDGDTVMTISGIYPDEASQGDVNLTVYTAFHPNGPETTHGPFSPATPTRFKATGRQARIRVDQVNPNWRVGTHRLDVVTRGRR